MKYTLTIISIILVIALFKHFPNYSRIRELEDENEQYVEQIDDMQKEIVDLEKDIDNFETDSFYFEKIARNELGIAKDNEVIVHVE